MAAEEDTLNVAKQCAKAMSAPLVIYLEGDLGAGKTTLSRGLIQAMGHSGAVKSPTYTLVETYQLPIATLHHFDLYRLADPEELEYMGIRDYFDDRSISLIEWPIRGAGIVPDADINITLGHRLDGRDLKITALSPRGEQWLDAVDI